MSIINGRYQLHESLGQGGMAEVFRATQINLEREVALKFIKPEAVGEDFERRFQREAKAIAQLNHPNITQVYDFEQAEDGRFYMVMELLRGQDLAAFLRRYKPLALPDILSIMGGVCAALAYAHQRGIVHRDIKPSNIFISEDNTVKVLDFGIAKWASAGNLTESGIAMGTPKYFAPEQARGQQLDQRADVYSLGVMFYELLTSQVPYSGDHITAIVMQHLEAPIPDPRELRPNLPPLVTAIILRALAKNPDERYPNVKALWADVLSLQASLEEDSPLRLAAAEQDWAALSASIEGQATPMPAPSTALVAPTPAPATQARPTLTQVLLADMQDLSPRRRLALLAAILALALGLGFLWLNRDSENTDGPLALDPTANISPAAPDEYLVLVAQWRGDSDGDLQRRISDLVQASEALSYSPDLRVRIEALPTEIRSQEEGQGLAQTLGAHLLIWGVKDELGVEVVMQDIAAEAGSIPQLRFIVPAGPDFAELLVQDTPIGLRYFLELLLFKHFIRSNDIDSLTGVGFLIESRERPTTRLIPGSDLDGRVWNLFYVPFGDSAAQLEAINRALQIVPEDLALRFLRQYNESFFEGNVERAALEAQELYEVMGSSNFSEWMLMNIHLLQQDYPAIIAASERLNPEQGGYDFALAYRHLALLMSGDFAPALAQVERYEQGGLVYGFLLWDTLRALLYRLQGNEAAYESLAADIRANRDLDSYNNALTGISNPPYALYLLGGFINEVNEQTALANFVYVAAQAINPDHFLLLWRQGAMQELRGQIPAAYALYGRAAEQAPVPLPIAFYDQARLVHSHPDDLPEAAPACELLAAAQAAAESDPAFYAPLLANLLQTQQAWDCA
jgi:hypothetical protein